MKGILTLLACGFAGMATLAQGGPLPAESHGFLLRTPLDRRPGAQTACLAVGRSVPCSATVGDLIEIDYRYRDQAGCAPVVQVGVSDGGCVVPSAWGNLTIDENAGGYKAAGYFFRATQPGSDTVTLVADGQTFAYTFQVAGSDAARPGKAELGRCVGESSIYGALLRPWISKSKGCAYVPAPGKYSVNMGDLVELDCHLFAVPGCFVTPTIAMRGGDAVDYIPTAGRVICDGSYGVTKYAFFFEALRPGKSTIVLRVKGQLLQYVIKVKATPAEADDPAEDDAPPEMLQGAGEIED